MQIEITRIHPASEPIRKSWDEDKLNELAQSIAEQGLIVPIKVRPENGGYEVVYGHRRLEAMRRNGATSIEAVVEGLDDTNALIQALIENIQREDIAPLDEANGYEALIQLTGWSQNRVADIVGKDRSRIAQMLAILKEPPEIQKMVERVGQGKHPGAITEGHIRVVGRAADRSLDTTTKVDILNKAQSEGLTMEQTNRVAQSVAAAPSEQAKKMLLEHEYSPVIHDPEHIKARAAVHGAHDPLYQNNSKSAQKEWDSTPEVKMVIDGVTEAAKAWATLIAEIRKMVQVGKLAPEGKSFTASKLRTLAKTLTRFADELEQEE